MKVPLKRPLSYRSGVLVVILATIASSLSGVFVRFVPELTGWQINCWRGYWMSVTLLIYLVLRYGSGTGDAFRKIPRAGLLTVAMFFAVGSTAYVVSLTLTTVANVSALGATSPIFTALLSHAATHERVNMLSWIAALLALVGVGVVINEGISGGHWIGNLVALFMALCFAALTVSLRHFSGFDLVPAVCLGGFLVFLIAGLGGGFEVSLRAVLILVPMGAIQLGIPLILFARGAASVPAVTLSLIVLLDVVLNPLWTWIGSGETPTLETAIGAAMIVAAVVLTILAGEWISRRAIQVDAVR
jgi:drug/metabolite transporter (DMT)-like permease